MRHIKFSKKGVTILQVLIRISLVIVPVLLIILNLFSEKINYKNVLTIFIIFVIFERILETFYTNKNKLQQNGSNNKRDYLLELMTVVYMILVIIIILDFFINKKEVFLPLTFFAMIVFFLSMALRWWGMFTLSKQWSIYSPTKHDKITDQHLVKAGPYKYIRHPIYLGFISEVASLPLILNSFYGLFFSLLIFIPLIILRTFREERILIKIFEEEYGVYKSKTPAFLPLKSLKRISHE